MLRRDGAIVELKVDKNSVVGYSSESNDVSTKAEESPLLRAVTEQRLEETVKGWRRLSMCCSDL
jgi:hypothetical protein